MATEFEETSTRTRRISKEETSRTSTTSRIEYPEVGVKKPEEIATESPEMLQIRKELETLLSDLILDVQRVGFELATLECNNSQNCPLVKQTRELIIKFKKLFEVQRKLMKLRSPS